MRSVRVLPIIRSVHRWVGLVAALPLAIQGLSGCFLALAGSLEPSDVASVISSAPPVSAGAVVAAAQTAVPHPAAEPPLPLRYVAPVGEHDEAEVDVAVSPGRVVAVWLDPASLTIHRMVPRDSGFVGTIRSLHTDLLMPALGGRSLSGCSGIALLVMIISGVPIWWPRRGRVTQAFMPDLKARGWTFHRRLHGAAGAWLGGMLLLMSITGMSMAFPSVTHRLLGLPPQPPRAGRGGMMMHGNTLNADAIDTAVRRAEATLPGATLRVMFLPTTSRAPVRLLFSDPRGGPRTEVRVTSESVSIVGADGSSGNSTLRWMHDLHTGAGLGRLWHIVLTLTGAALVLLTATGWLMWLRMRSRKRQAPTRSFAATGET